MNKYTMKKSFIIFIVLILSVSFVSAVSTASFDMRTELRTTVVQLAAQGLYDEGLVKDILIMKKTMLGTKVPLKALFGNEHIQLNVALESGKTLILCVDVKDGFIVSMDVCSGEGFSPAAIAYTTVDVLSDLEGKSDSITNALRNKQITFEAIGFKNKIKFAALRFI